MQDVGSQQCSKCLNYFEQQQVASITSTEKYCQECLEEVLNLQQMEIKQLQQRYIFYKQFQSSLDEKDLIFQSNPTNINHSNQPFDLQRLTQQLKILNANCQSIKQQCSNFTELVYTMQLQEIKFWDSINRFDKRAVKLQEKILSAKFDRLNSKSELDILSQKSILHSFFSIEIDDNIGFVYGLAMGRRSETVDINWDDVNAGIGHLCLGFHFLILKYGLKYEMIEEIKLKGSLTEILIKGKKQFVPIGYSGRQGQKVFGEVLQILLSELLNLGKKIRQSQSIQQNEQIRLPFQIDEKDMKIGQFYIDPTKLQQRMKWTNWTKAMRYFLINFKHVLTMHSLSDNLL